MIQVGFLLLLCIAAVTAQAPPPKAPAPAPASAPCVSKFNAVKDFDAKQLDGIWYDVRRIKAAPDRPGTCEAAKYKANDDGSITVDLRWVDGNGATQKVPGTIKPAGTNPKEAKLTVTLKDKSAEYTIFHKADTFFGVYACLNKQGYVWVFAKTFEVDDTKLAPITKAMTDSGLSSNLLKKSIQGGCPDVFL